MITFECLCGYNRTWPKNDDYQWKCPGCGRVYQISRQLSGAVVGKECKPGKVVQAELPTRTTR